MPYLHNNYDVKNHLLLNIINFGSEIKIFLGGIKGTIPPPPTSNRPRPKHRADGRMPPINMAAKQRETTV
jgi:hypothetical protein